MWRRILLIVCIVSSSLFSFSQTSSQNLGSIKGVVRDSLLDYGLPSATLALYKKADNSLVAYQLSNNLGEFQFSNVPLGLELKLIATYISYKSLSRTVSLNSTARSVDLKAFNLYKDENVLSEVEIKAIAPVTMNGDTLEFNADAFQLDPNAVTEDLLRKLPGVIVWGDGTITVNGKEIKSLLVNGKPFFGGNSQVSTQNIPKDALDKVQVYRTDINPNNPLDTITEVNLKLKREKSMGYFGKISAGRGTDDRYEADASINFFDKQNQIGLIGAVNNINKTANNISSLLKNSTFKGVGANIDYQPNFKSKGLNRSTNGGLIFQHDFAEESNDLKKNRLSLDYFSNIKDNLTFNEVNSRMALGDNLNQLTYSSADNVTRISTQESRARYEKSFKNYNLILKGEMIDSKIDIEKRQSDSIANNALGLQSLRNLSVNSKSNGKNYSLGAVIQHLKSRDASSNLPGNWMIDYFIEGAENERTQNNQTDFISVSNPANNSFFNRLNKVNISSFNHHLNTKLGDLSPLLFGNYVSRIKSISVELLNDVRIGKKDLQNDVFNLAEDSGLAIYDTQLSSNQITNEIDERPNLKVSKSYYTMLSNRFTKSLLVEANLQGQLYNFRNKSSQTFQNFQRNYQKFIPKASLNYSNEQYGEFKKDIVLNYISSFKFPTPEQLYPIVDYSNIYNVQLGNSNLLPSKQHQIAINYNFLSRKSKQTFTYNLGSAITLIKNNHSLYTSTDEDGRSTYSFVNLNGYRSIGFNSELVKAFKKQDHLFQIKVNADLVFNRVPQLNKNFQQTEPVLNVNDNSSKSFNLLLFYSLKDILAINLNQYLNDYSYKLADSEGGKLTSTNQISSLAASIKLSPKFAIASNFDYNRTTFTGSADNNFSIWNASATYRFMKGNNLEAKLTAMDLLRQNKSVETIVNGNMIRQSNVNVLQQYYMLTISYYPRKFGKRNDKNR